MNIFETIYKNQKLKMGIVNLYKNLILRTWLLIVGMILLTSCGPLMQECITNAPTSASYGASPIVTENSKNVAVNSSVNTWINSGVIVQNHDTIVINVSGSAFFKNSIAKTITVPASSSSKVTVFDDGTTLSLSGIQYMIGVTPSTIPNTSTGVNAPCVDGTCSPVTSPFCANNLPPIAGCYASNGLGVNIYIGNTLITNSGNNNFIVLSSFLPGSFAPTDNTTYQGLPVYSALAQYAYIFTTTNSGLLGFQFSGHSSTSTGSYNLSVVASPMDMAFTSINGDGVNKGANKTLGVVEYIISSTRPLSSDIGTAIIPYDGYSATYNGASGNTIWLRVLDNRTNNAQPRTTNNGAFNVTVATQFTETSGLVKFLNQIIGPVTAQTMAASKLIYKAITINPSFQKAIRLMLLLYIIVYAISYLSGMVQISQQDLVIRVIKIAAIVILISPNSWGFYNAYFINLFTSGTDYIIASVTGQSTTTIGTGSQIGNSGGSALNNTVHIVNPAGIFGFFDIILQQFFSPQVWIGMSSYLAITCGVGIVFVYLFIKAIFKYLMVLIEAFIGYIFVIISVSFLISIAPIFICLILFEKTKEYFANWHKWLFYFSIQPIILLVSLMILNELIMQAFWSIITFKICWRPIFSFYLDLESLLGITMPPGLKSIPLVVLKWYKLIEPSSPIGIFGNFLSFLIYVKILENILEIAPEIAEQLSSLPGAGAKTTGGGSPAHQIAGHIESAGKAIKKGIGEAGKMLTGQDEKSKQRRKNASEQQNQQAGANPSQGSGSGHGSPGGASGHGSGALVSKSPASMAKAGSASSAPPALPIRSMNPMHNKLPSGGGQGPKGGVPPTPNPSSPKSGGTNPLMKKGPNLNMGKK